MALQHEAWTRIEPPELAVEWMQAEFKKYFSNHPDLVLSPDLTSAPDNKKRWRILLSMRPLLRWVPPDTEWYRVEVLEPSHFNELHSIAWCGWDLAHNNELVSVAAVKKYVLQSHPATWNKPILWGHSKQGPFTILEGNHRLHAWAYNPPTDTPRIPIIIGISQQPCHWHIFDGKQALPYF